MAGLIRFFAIQSNLYMMAPYKAITLYIMVTKQLPENHALYTVSINCKVDLYIAATCI